MIGSFWYGGIGGRNFAVTARSEGPTAKSFDVHEVCADKAYASVSNYEMCAEHGVTPPIDFEANHSGGGKGRSETAVDPDDPRSHAEALDAGGANIAAELFIRPYRNKHHNTNA